MKLFTKALAVPAIVGLLGMSAASQAMVVSEGFELGGGVFDSGELTLAAGDYSLNLEAFTFGPAGPFIFGISNDTEEFQVSIAEFGSASTFFSTVGFTSFAFILSSSSFNSCFFFSIDFLISRLSLFFSYR